MDEELKLGLAESIADYVETHHAYDNLTKREAIIQAVHVLTDDIGAAQRYLQAIGVDLDLYTYDFTKRKRRFTIINDPPAKTMADFARNLIRIEVTEEDLKREINDKNG